MSSQPIIITILGADRVGKSTLAEKTAKDFRSRLGLNVIQLHFAGPQPHHCSPIEQYTVPLDATLGDKPDVIICDRGFAEVAFYDKFRRHVDISEEWVFSAEAYFSSRASKLHTLLLVRPWDWARPHHIVEIKEQYPDASEYFIRNQLLMRETEHHAYYEYMEEYLDKRSLIPHRKLMVNYREPPDLISLTSTV
jgi:hypothetical protein